MIVVVFKENYNYANATSVWKYDYGQILRIQGLNLPSAVEVHFSLQDRDGDSVTRIGVTRDNVTDVPIPDSLLENDVTQDYCIYAFIYIRDKESGETVKKISIDVKSRPKPEVFENSEDAELFSEAITAVNESYVKAADEAKNAEAWAHGHEDYPDRWEDNAKYYSEKAKDIMSLIPGSVEIAKKEINKYVVEKEAYLKGETGNVYFASFKVENGRLKMYSDPSVDKVCFERSGSRLKYRIAI